MSPEPDDPIIEVLFEETRTLVARLPYSELTDLAVSGGAEFAVVDLDTLRRAKIVSLPEAKWAGSDLAEKLWDIGSESDGGPTNVLTYEIATGPA